MLSLENLIEYLEPNQVKLSESVKLNNKCMENSQSHASSYKELSEIYDEYFLYGKSKFTFFRNKNISKNEFFNFINSILVCIDNNYGMLSSKNKILKIKVFLKKLLVDFDEKNLYYEFNYNKNRKIKKQVIQEFLYGCLKDTHKFIGELSKNYVDQLICDYFGINLVLFNILDGVIDMESSRIIHTTKYENKFNKYVPVLFMSKIGDEYESIMLRGETYLVKYSENRELLNNIFKKFNICVNRKELEAMTIVDLREKCKESGIETTKISVQSKKKINKRKGELIEELGMLDFI
jgi:hypothetical protein